MACTVTPPALFESRLAALPVRVERDPQLALGGILAHALEQRVVVWKLHGDVICAWRFGHVPDVDILFIGHVHGRRQLELVNAHASVVVHFAERFVLVHRNRNARVLHLRLDFLHRSLLLRRQLPTSSAGPAPLRSRRRSSARRPAVAPRLPPFRWRRKRRQSRSSRFLTSTLASCYDNRRTMEV